MRITKTIAARIAVDQPPSARAALATIALKLPVTAWRAFREIGGNCSNYPTCEATIRAAPAYRKRYPACRDRIPQVKQYWGLQLRA